MLVFFCAVVPGCVTTIISRSDPKYQYIVSQDYYVSITPVRTKSYFYAFRLIVKNQTKQDIWINWDKTKYVFEEDANGGFMFDGVDYKEREASKPMSRVPANDIFIKTIWPNVLVDRNKDWFHQPLESGRHGIELTIISGRQVFEEKLLLSISVQEP